MGIREEFDRLMDRMKVERDRLNLKMHLTSMDAKKKFAGAEKKWGQIKTKVAEIAYGAVETSEGYVSKAKVIGEELKDTYHRIAKRLSD